MRVFRGCDKLPTETLVMGSVRSTDITSRVRRVDLRETIKDFCGADCDYFRHDVFELLAKNKCFRNNNVKVLFEKMISEDMTELFPVAEKYEMLSNVKLVDMLIDYVVELQKPEGAAYLLDLKNRKFGFKESDLNL